MSKKGTVVCDTWTGDDFSPAELQIFTWEENLWAIDAGTILACRRGEQTWHA